MKVDTEFTRKSATSIFKVDLAIPDSFYNTEKKLKTYIKESRGAAEIRVALIR
jgi:TfoX/Sxy family transcriptional regulator of competence genes